MNPHEAIARLSKAIALVNSKYDKDELLHLIQDIVDEKHLDYIHKGLALNDKASILHGLMGALSHYESENEKTK